MTRVLSVGMGAELAAQLGQHDLQSMPHTEIADMLKQFDEPCHAVVLGPEHEAPLAAAQAVHAADPLVSVVIVCHDEELARLRRDHLFTPFLGDHVAITPSSELTVVKDALGRAVQSTAARRAHAEHMTQDVTALPAGPDWEIRADELIEPLLQLAPIGVVLLDESGRVREWNRCAERILGVSKSEAINRRLPPLMGEAYEVMERILGGAVAEEPIRVRSAPESFVRVTTSVLRTPHGTGTLALLQDATADVVAESARRHAEEQLAAAQRLESLGTLAGGIAHDFNNLLAVIQSSAEFAMLELPAGSAAAEPLGDIAEASKTAAGLTAAMLTYAGRETAHIEPLSLGGTLFAMERLLRASCGKRVELSLELTEAPLVVAGDRRQLQQILVNLVTNAAEAIAPGRGTVRIKTQRIAREAALGGRAAALLEVRDDGPGMADEVRQRLFEPFFSTKQIGRGRGLGLAAVHGIVESHGGVIACESTRGEGTTFRVLLPAMEATPSAPAPDPTPTSGATAKTILLAEDEGTVAKATSRLLERHGYRVEVVSDGLECLEALRVGSFDLVLLDMCMPRMGGREALGRIRHLYPELPVIMCSGYVGETVSDLIGEGPTLFMKKPFVAAELFAAIDSIC